MQERCRLRAISPPEPQAVVPAPSVNNYAEAKDDPAVLDPMYLRNFHEGVGSFGEQVSLVLPQQTTWPVNRL